MKERLVELCDNIITSCKSSLCADCEYNNIDYPNCMSVHFADKIFADGWMRPPCKVGDKVYDISEFYDGTNCPEIYEYTVERIEITEEKGQQVLYIADLKYPSDEWGKSLHFSREQAESKLKEGGQE